MGGPEGYINTAHPHPAKPGAFIAAPLEVWGPGHVTLCGSQETASEADALAWGAARIAEHEARHAATLAAELGELLETLPNGLELRRRIEHGAPMLFLFDPTALRRGPYRGTAIQGEDAEGVRTWRLTVHYGGFHRRRYRTEDGARAAMRRGALLCWPVADAA